jgi:hypothetical protein
MNKNNIFIWEPKLIKIHLRKKFVWPARAIALYIGVHYAVATYAMYEAGYVTAYMGISASLADSLYGFNSIMFFRFSVLFLVFWLAIGGIRELPGKCSKNEVDH